MCIPQISTCDKIICVHIVDINFIIMILYEFVILLL